MTYTLRYSSTRAEIWRLYWRIWRKHLWRIHVALAVLAGLILSRSQMTVVHVLSYSLAAFPVVVAAFAAFPQLAFKSQERLLHVGPDGWSSQIGKKSGARTWAEVATVDEQDGAVVIRGVNGNALVVPARAFATEAERVQFVTDIGQWRGQNAD